MRFAPAACWRRALLSPTLVWYTERMKDCIYCKIVRGTLPTTKVYEDEHVIAILDINPVSQGHTLVIPKSENSNNILDISEDDWLAVSRIVHKIAPAVEKGVGADGVNIVMNNRSHAGQVIDHPHVHIIPRFKGDGLRQWSHSKYKEGEAPAIGDKIRAALQN